MLIAIYKLSPQFTLTDLFVSILGIQIFQFANYSIIKMFRALLLAALIVTISSSRILAGSPPANSYPIRFAYINRLDWSSSKAMAKSMGVPGYATPHLYNYICLTFWTFQQGALDAALAWNRSSTYLSSFGSSDQEIRANIKKIYNDNGIKLMVSAFGATQNPTSAGYNATFVAKLLADFVIYNNLDGVDVDWEDSAMFEGGNAGKGQAWLIELTTVLRTLLPTSIITHAPQGPYFAGTSVYSKNAYLQVENKVGSLIQFYNVQFYNQGSTGYNTSDGLFNISGGWAAGTSVNQIIKKGVKSQKIVVGKPATTADAGGGYMNIVDIGTAAANNYIFNGWKAGVMFWQYSSDANGTLISQAITPLMNLISNNPLSNNSSNVTSTNSTNNTTTSNSTNSTPANNITNTSNTNISIWNPSLPVRMTYISTIMYWSGVNSIAISLSIPGYTKSNIYNVVCIGFWTVRFGPVNAAILWANPIAYFGAKSQFGTTNTQIRASLKSLYTSKGIKLLLGVFGQIDLPSTFNYDPITTAKNLAAFVLNNNFDGIDVNWNDIYAFQNGNAEKWIIRFTLAFRSEAPMLIITHSPKASYFSDSLSYPFGGYNEINRQVGSYISFYSLIYYGTSATQAYNTTQAVFNSSGTSNPKTSILQLMNKGISPNKLVVGKPVIKMADFSTRISDSILGKAMVDQYKFNKWRGGFMLWQFSNDFNGTFINNIMSPFRNTYPSLFS